MNVVSYKAIPALAVFLILTCLQLQGVRCVACSPGRTGPPVGDRCLEGSRGREGSEGSEAGGSGGGCRKGLYCCCLLTSPKIRCQRKCAPRLS